MTKLIPALSTVLAMTVAAPALAAPSDVLPTKGDEISDFRNAGKWKVRKNETRKSCFASYRADNDAIVQFGFTKDESVGYLGLFGKNASVTESEQKVAVLVNDHIYAGEASGVGPSIQDGYEGGYILVNNPEFVADIKAAGELIAFPETDRSYIVDMSGASDALYEVRKCTDELKLK